MFKYYRKMSANVTICYLISFFVLFGMLMLSAALYYNASPKTAGAVNTALIVASVAAAGIVSFTVCNLMKNTVILSEKDIKADGKLIPHLKRIISCILLMSLVSVALSLMGGFVVARALDMFTILRWENFPLFCVLIKIPLFIIFLVFLAFMSRHTGLEDAATRSFNPHLMFIALLLSLTFMLPGTIREYMYESNESIGNSASAQGIKFGSDHGKLKYDIQAAFSKNVDLYKSGNTLNNEFSVSWMIISMLASMAAQIAVAMTAYNMGRKAYYAKHPHMSSEELNMYMSGVN